MMDAVALALVVFAAFTTQAVTGFGAVILSLSVGALFVPMPVLLPVLVTASTALNASYFVRDRAEIDRRVILARVLPWMGAGVGVGLLVGARVDTSGLTRGFGAFVVALALWQLWRSRRPAAGGAAADSAAVASVWLVAAGVVHGLVASGGPLLVHAMQREGLSPRRFRATLLTIWLVLNLGLLVAWGAQGRFTAEVARWVAVAAPAVVAAVVVGDRLHRQLDPDRYRRVVYVVLLVSGVLLAAR